MFVFLSWITCFLTGCLLFIAYKNRPQVIVKPSFAVAVFFFLQDQIGSTLQAGWIDRFLLNPWPYYFVVQFFPLILSFISGFFFNTHVQEVYTQAEIHLKNQKLAGFRQIYFLFGLVALIVFWYLREVPFQRTGLYAMLFLGPEFYAMAREESMALLDNKVLVYGYLLMSTTLVPLLSAALSIRMYFSFFEKKYLVILGYLAGLLSLLGAASLYGAKGESAISIACAGYVFFLIYGGKKTQIKIFLAFIPAILFFPMIIALLSEGADFSLENVQKFSLNVLDRAMGRKILPNVWHLDFVQESGYHGVAGVPVVARFFSEQPKDFFNLVNLKYAEDALKNGTANANFAISYFCCFGYPGLVLCIFLVIFLDGFLLFYRLIDGRFFIPCLAAVQVSCSKFISTHYTTVFITGGLILIPIFGILLSRIFSEKTTEDSRFEDIVPQNA